MARASGYRMVQFCQFSGSNSYRSTMKKHLLRLIKKGATQPLLFKLIYKRQGPVVPVVMYHGVSDYDQITPVMLEEQFDWISKNFTSYFASEMEEAKLDSEAIILTFDDGLRNNAEIVFPLLEKYGLKATFYVVSGLLSGTDMLWNHEATARFSQLTENDRKLHFGDSASDINAFVSSLKLRSTAEALSVVAKLRTMTSVDKFTDEHRVKYQIMSEQELLQIDPNIVEIGAHSHTHPILDQLSLDEAIEEITTSKSLLEKLLKRPVDSFCYPNGDYQPELVSTIEKNFKTAVTTVSGVCSTSGFDRAQIPRLFVLPDITDYKFNIIKPMRNS